MKKNIFLVIIISQLLFLIGCKQNELPTEPNSTLQGEYFGSFYVTFNNYHNSSERVTQTGEIAFVFKDSGYSYIGVVKDSVKDTIQFEIKDSGRFEKTGNRINMYDVSWLKMNPGWFSSLYLTGTFSITTEANCYIITQENDFAKWKINLIKK